MLNLKELSWFPESEGEFYPFVLPQPNLKESNCFVGFFGFASGNKK